MDSMEKLVDRKGWRVIRENSLGLVSFLSGTTKRVAIAIADAAGADLYEITPVEPYTSDDLNWTNSSSRVSREHDDESLRDIALTEITPADWVVSLDLNE